MLDRLLRAAVRRAAVGEERDELFAVANEAVQDGTRRDAIAELVGLVGLALRLRCRRATGDDAVLIWRQGLWFGALLLAALALIELGARAITGHEPLVVMAFSTGSVAYVAAVSWKPRVLAVAGPIVGVTAILSTVGVSGAGSDLVRLAVLGVAGLLGAPVRGRGNRASVAWFAPVVIAVVSATLLGVGTTLDASVVAVVAVVGAVCLVAGWADPRLAIAVTVVWCWRFLAVDPPRVGDAVMALAGDLDLEALLIRWIAMAAGVTCGLAVSRLSVRRAVAL